MSVLQVENLQLGYEDKLVGKPFTFSLEKGKLYTLIGKNGMGKSTLIKTLSQVLPPISGNISIQNKDLKEISLSEFSKKISFVFTNQPIHKELTVLELIALGRQPYTNWMHQITADDEKIVQNAIDFTQIKKYIHRKLYHLSDGQLQRVLIARAIAQDTEIILLDEPSNHLDLYYKVQLFRLLKRLCTEFGKTVLFSCHDLDLAIQQSNEMLVIKEDNNYFGTPDRLISEGIFDNFFQDQQILFDREQKRFVIL